MMESPTVSSSRRRGPSTPPGPRPSCAPPCAAGSTSTTPTTPSSPGGWPTCTRTPEARARLKKSDGDWLAALGKLDFDKLSREGRVDYLLLKNHIEHELRRLDLPPAKEAGKKDASGIVGRPIGREALLVELAGE